LKKCEEDFLLKKDDPADILDTEYRWPDEKKKMGLTKKENEIRVKEEKECEANELIMMTFEDIRLKECPELENIGKETNNK